MKAVDRQLDKTVLFDDQCVFIIGEQTIEYEAYVESDSAPPFERALHADEAGD